MKNLEKKPFEECKIELIELGDDVIITSAWQSAVGPNGEGGQWNDAEGGSSGDD